MSPGKKYSNIIIVLLIIIVLILLLIIFTDIHVAKINRDIQQVSSAYPLPYDYCLTGSHPLCTS